MCDFTAAIDYLREETHGPERAGAIVLSGLTGYILGLRKGIIRRLFYTSLGALGMAAICYPNDAAVYTDEALQEGKRYFIIAYHFIYGGRYQTISRIFLFRSADCRFQNLKF